MSTSTDFAVAALAAGAVLLVARGLGAPRSDTLAFLEAYEKDGVRRREQSSSALDRLAQDMVRAGWKIRVGELAGIWALGGLVLGGLLTVGFHNPAIGLVLGLVGSFAAIIYALRISVARRAKLIDLQLVQALSVISSLVAVGKMVPQAFEEAAKRVGAPLSTELEWVGAQYKAGADLVMALRRVGERLNSQEWDYFVTAVDMQERRGGDLAKLLGNLVGGVTTRIQLRGDMKAMLAEAQVTKIVAGGMPVFLFFAMAALVPSSTKLLFTTPAGLVMFFLAVFLWFMGVVVTSRMVAKVKI